MPQYEVTESIDIAAPREVVWAAVSDPTSYARWSPENIRARRLGPPAPTWRVGDQFVGTNRLWVRWSTKCTVVVADELRTFAFDVEHGVFPVARWEYSLTHGSAGSIRVTERWTDHRTGWLGTPFRATGLLVGRGLDAAVRNRDTMRATLAAMKAALESDTAGAE